MRARSLQARNNKVYGYLIEKGDGDEVVENLWNAAVNYTIQVLHVAHAPRSRLRLTFGLSCALHRRKM